jgi:DNA-binding CsgD family transcriptional regulator
MEELILSPNYTRILDMIIMGVERKEIAIKLNITINTLYGYIKDMNQKNDCNLYQLVWKYAHVGTKYTIKAK